MIEKAVKGQFGYLAAKRKLVLIRTIIFFAVPLSLLAAGIISTGSRRNLLTIVAVLGCLPACKSLVSLILYIRARGCGDEAHRILKASGGSLEGMYDMYFTSYRQNFAISHMVSAGKNLCGFTEDPKCDAKACEEHLTAMLRQGGCKEITLKIFTDLDKYCERLRQLNRLCEESGAGPDDGVIAVLYDISL